MSTPIDNAEDGPGHYTQRFAELKRRLVKKENEEAVIKAWNEVLAELEKETKEFVEKGDAVIPQVEFTALHQLSEETLANVRRRGALLVKNVVDDEEVLKWKAQLREYTSTNPVDGWPKENKQFFMTYWAKAQVEARSHPNVLAASAFMNSLWYTIGVAKEPISLSTPVSAANRFRIRPASDEVWTNLMPHIDDGSIERWEDDGFIQFYQNIFKGDWKNHDAYVVDYRLMANSNIYKRPGQGTLFRAWQGWLAMSNTGPSEGTLQLFPDLLLSSAYIILRPFFRIVDPDSSTPLAPSNWVLDLTTTEFPAIEPLGKYFGPIRPTKESHPHMRVDVAMVSVPKVAPGDMIFWHNDVTHAVESRHHGKGDSSVMYISPTPLTLTTMKTIINQRDQFLSGIPPVHLCGPTDIVGEGAYVGKGTAENILSVQGKRAMALEPFDESSVDDPKEKDVLKAANALLAAAA